MANSGSMARLLRIHVTDGWHHVMSRATGVETVSRRDEDRRRFMELKCELPEQFGTEMRAWGEAGKRCAGNMGTGGRAGWWLW